jgi:hypothetical protein
VCARACVRVCLRACERVCVCVRVRVRVHVHVRMCVRVRVHMCVRVHVCVCLGGGDQLKCAYVVFTVLPDHARHVYSWPQPYIHVIFV